MRLIYPQFHVIIDPIAIDNIALRCAELSWLELSQHHIKLNNNNRTTRNSCLFIISIIIMGSVLCVLCTAYCWCACAYPLVWSLSVCTFQFNCCIYFHLWSIFFFLFLSFVDCRIEMDFALHRLIQWLFLWLFQANFETIEWRVVFNAKLP